MNRICAMMKSIATVVAATALLWNAAPALADEASKTAKVEEMLQLTHVDRLTTQVLDQMKGMITAQTSQLAGTAEARQEASEIQQKLLAMVADRMSWTKIKPAYIRIYSETFSEADIDGVLAFYKSPAGQAMLDKMPQLMQKSMALGQQMMGDVLPEVERMMTEVKQRHQK